MTTTIPAFISGNSGCGRLIFIHLQCWEVLPFCRFQRQRCIKFVCPKDPDFYTPLALKTAKGPHLSALEVYKNQSPRLLHLKCLFPQWQTEARQHKRCEAASFPGPLERPPCCRWKDLSSFLGNLERATTTTSAFITAVSQDATSKVPFPQWQTEARQHKRSKDAASDVCLSCSCFLKKRERGTRSGYEASKGSKGILGL